MSCALPAPPAPAPPAPAPQAPPVVSQQPRDIVVYDLTDEVDDDEPQPPIVNHQPVAMYDLTRADGSVVVVYLCP
jgi:hypothetical protein